MNVLPEVTEPPNGRDGAIATNRNCFACLYSLSLKLASTPWSVGENTDFGASLAAHHLG